MHGWTFLLTRPLRDVTQGIAPYCPRCGFLLTRPLRDVTKYSKIRDCVQCEFLLTRPLRDVTDSGEHTGYK